MQRNTVLERCTPAIISLLIAIPLVIALCVIYVQAEHPAYIWDYGAYWRMFQIYGGQISDGVPGWATRLRHDISTQDYNPFSTIPLYPFYYFLGGSRPAYLIAVGLGYLLPAAVITTILASQAADKSRHFFSAIFVIAGTYVQFWAPTLRGMIDVCGLIFIGLATLLVLNTNFLSRRALISGAILGVLIWMPFLMRRWYAFSIVSLIGFTFVFGMIARIRAGQTPLRALISFIPPLALAGTITLCFLLIFQKDLVLRVVNTSYAEIYVAYQIPFRYHFLAFLQRMGGYELTLMFVGVVIAVVTRNVNALFCTACATGTFIMFIRTQQIGPHHLLPIAFWLFVPYTLAAYRISRLFTFLPDALKLVPFAIISVGIFLASITTDFRRTEPIVSFFVPFAVVPPLELPNYSEYERLVADLRAQPDLNEKFAVFASSYYMSDALITSLAPEMEKVVSYATQVAEIDPFHFDNLNARYVIVTDRPLIHLPLQSQAVITVPNEQILTGKGIGAAYKQIGTPYEIGDGAKAYLMRRERPLTAKEVGELVDALGAYYPDWRAKLRNAMTVPFGSRTDTHDSEYGQVAPRGPNKLFMHPGASQPTRTSLTIDDAVTARPTAVVLSVPESILKTCPNADGVAVTMSWSGETLWIGDVLPGHPQTVPLPAKNGTLDLSVDKRALLDCDHLYAEFQMPK